jgi:hypothetical protein
MYAGAPTWDSLPPQFQVQPDRCGDARDVSTTHESIRLSALAILVTGKLGGKKKDTESVARPLSQQDVVNVRNCSGSACHVISQTPAS